MKSASGTVTVPRFGRKSSAHSESCRLSFDSLLPTGVILTGAVFRRREGSRPQTGSESGEAPTRDPSPGTPPGSG